VTEAPPPPAVDSTLVVAAVVGALETSCCDLQSPTAPTIAVISAARPVRIPGNVVQKARKPPLRSFEGSPGIDQS
jgi:hypothetical protein